MIKARPAAGDLELGRRFLADLAPFIWRKYFDYAAIADIHAMKRQIHAVRGHERVVVPGHDVKLGRGGIREVEFFVQTQQLIFGGRRPRAKERRSARSGHTYIDIILTVIIQTLRTEQTRTPQKCRGRACAPRAAPC